MGLPQWIVVHIINSMKSDTISVKNAAHSYGKFYRNGNKDIEISIDDINKITVAPDGSADIGACGRQDSWSGTTGSFELYDGDSKICTISWDCPWGKPTNEFGVSEQSKDYWVQPGAWNREGGAIGTVDVEVGKKG
ncbi:aegerolysin family protein [Aspergillus homomorphus CBS 101889]|uniref:Aegerolysin family protein n=1 Tax=Aspergillus homomorphus (strain CBS 101889) TaxID=1450537 RepID=A0A395HKF2_ASPHC|nr:Aegerolysin family protein [Aspergillus homomorphus CBS 101889]RAL08230.1 Aegerolysin family protein [Aspergillus homomorphus CBS 101889]